MSPPRNNVVINPNSVMANDTKPAVQNGVIGQACPDSPVDLSGLSEADIRALKKQQRMIKNRYVFETNLLRTGYWTGRI